MATIGNNNIARILLNFRREESTLPIKGVRWSNLRNAGHLEPSEVRIYNVGRPMRHKKSAKTRTRLLRPNIHAYTKPKYTRRFNKKMSITKKKHRRGA
jgi:hypothetical protein